MKVLINDVITWGRDKGIHDKLSASSQMVFAIGELCNELPDAMAKGKPPEEIKKELGDVMVFYINNLVMQYAYSAEQIVSCVDDALTGSDYYGDMNDINEIILRGLDYSECGIFGIIFFEMLHAIAKRLDTTLEECLQLAHDKNTKRRHTMRAGKLVKEGD